MVVRGSYKQIPVEDIKASSITYEQLIIRCLDRLDLMLNEKVLDESIFVTEAKIRYIDSLLNPYWNDDLKYKETRKKIEKLITLFQSDEAQTYKILMSWIRLISTKFGKMNILPDTSKDLTAGRGF